MSGYDFRDACEAGDLDKVKGLSIFLKPINSWKTVNLWKTKGLIC